MAYRILKNAGLLPPEVELQKEILRLTDLAGGASWISAVICPRAPFQGKYFHT